MRLLAVVVLVVTLAACDRSTGVSIEVRAGTTPEVARYEVALFEGGGCPDVTGFATGMRQPVLSVVFPPDRPMALGERRESGPHALAVLGRDAQCRPVSFGCTGLQLGATDTVTVTLSEVDGFTGSACGERTCQGGACVSQPGPDAGVPDANVRDAGPACGDGVGCGDPAIARCESGHCQLLPGVPEVRASLAGAARGYGPEVHVAHTTLDGAVTVHVAGVETGRDRAVVSSLALGALDGTVTRTELPEDARARGWSVGLHGQEDILYWSVAGQTEPVSNVGVWVGTLLEPGEVASSVPLSGSNREIGLGPQLVLGGTTLPIRYLSVTRDEIRGVLQTGTVPTSPSPSDYLPWTMDPVPGGTGQTGAVASGLVVMEILGGRDIAVWRAYPESDAQSIEARPEGARGPLGLADLGGERYVLAYPVGDDVRLVVSDCDPDCSFRGAAHTAVAAGSLVALDLVGTPRETALLVEAYEADGQSVLTVRPIGRDGQPGTAQPLLDASLDVERIARVDADFVTTPGSYELLVAVLLTSVSDPSTGRVALVRRSFPRR